MNTRSRRILRKEATYLVQGTWPKIAEEDLPNWFTEGDEYLIAIIRVKENKHRLKKR